MVGRPRSFMGYKRASRLIIFVRIDCIAVGIGAIAIIICLSNDIVLVLVQCKLYAFMDIRIIGKITSAEFVF